MQYNQHEFHEVVSRFRANSQAARIPPPPSCSPPRFTAPPANNKHYVLSEVELATFRTQLCESHQRNRCAHPDACPHSHCLTWQRRNPYEIIYDPHLCPGIEFRRTNSKMSLIRHCTRGRSCAYAHSKEEELYHPLMYKTKPCTVFPKCDRHYCPFAHSTAEVRQPFNNPLINYIWGSPSGIECNDPNDAVHRWTLSPLASLTRPLLVTETSRLPSLPGGPLQEQSLHLQQSQLPLQHQQQQITQQRWPQGSQQTSQSQIWEQPHGVNTPAAPSASLYTFAIQQQRKQQQQRLPYLVGAAKQTSTPEVAQQALSGYSNTKQEMVFSSAFDAVQHSRMPNQRPSHLRHTAGIVQSLKVAGEEGPRRDTNERTGKGRRPAGVEQPVLSQSLSAEEAVPSPGTGDLEGTVRDGGRESQQRTLPAPSDTASSTTTTVSTDLQDLLDSESVRRALIMTLAQQLIGPQVNQLSVDQVLIVLDLAVKLAPHLHPTAPGGASFFSPSPTGELLQLDQTESDTPQQSSSIGTNAVTQALRSAASQDRISGSGSNGNLQRGHMLQQPQQQGANEASAASASRDARSTTTCLARPTTTDDLLGDTTSSSLFDPQLQDTDPAASLAATQVLIEQLRKLSLLNVCEEASHSCSSPAPSLEEAETSSLSIVRGSSTGVWSTSTSPIVGGSSDLSSRYANLSSRHVDLVPTTAMTAAATTFASASSSADEASLCACPSLTITQDLNAGSDKNRNLRTPHAAAADNSNVVENSVAAASTFPRKLRGKLCASPVEQMFHEHSARLPNRRGSSGGNADCVTTHTAIKTTPSFSTVLGGESLSPQLRGLLPPPGTNGTGFTVQEAHTDLSSASYALPLADHDSSRRFSDCAAGSVAAASSPTPPPPPLQQQQGSFGQASYTPLASAQKPQQDTSLQKRAPLTGTLAAARKLSEPFSPQVTTCSHSPSAGQFNSPQCFTGAASSAEPTPAYSARLPESSTSNKHRFRHTKDNYHGGTKSGMHGSKNAFPDGQYRQRVRADGPQGSA